MKSDVPWEPLSMGVALSQRKEAERAYGCKFVERGNWAVPHFKNRSEGNKVLRRNGWYNYDAGYSDPAPHGSPVYSSPR